MARKKTGNKPPRPQGPPGRQRGGFMAKALAERSSNLSPASPAGGARGHGHGYSLAEEARNTAFNRRGPRGVDARLRHRPVRFVSAGFMDPLKDLEVEQKGLDKTPQEKKGEEELPPTVTTSDNAGNAENSPAEIAPAENAPATIVTSEDTKEQEVDAEITSPPPFVLDLTGDKSLRPDPSSTTGASVPVSHYDSDSSEEIILFKGRDASRQNRNPAKPRQTTHKASAPHANNTKNTLELGAIDREIRVVERSIQTHDATTTRESKQESVQRQVRKTAVETEDHISLSNTKKRGGRPRRNASVSTTSDEEAAMIADYIANMQDDADEDEDEDADEGDKHPDIGSHAFQVLRDLGGTDSDAVPGEISSDGNSSDGSLDDEVEDEERRRHREFTDEHMARMLAKQEELGLGGDDVLLFDGSSSDDEEDWQVATKGTPRRKKKGSSKQARIVQRKGQYPSATQMADAFDDLDLMDWQRPALNNFKKAPETFNCSDSELEEAMNIAWRKDRLKKAEKKKAREELRAQGLLGKNVNPEDLRVKYRGGMSIDDLANELEAFLTGTQEQLSLPPFDKRSRMTVHQLANKFKIKSQSAGKGNSRYTVFYRSRATLPFEQVSFDRALARVHQTWFPRVDVDAEIVHQTRLSKRSEPRRVRVGGGGGGGGKSALTFREGDVVGQGALELGAANKGRTILEKMGWTKGMGLGSGDNKGITVPLTQIMKKSKAGLGDA
ncbi:squalene synthetase-like protein [Diatrype stigma]|uniref:Protein SQS1 n=1 Tax=Diatrype stigma TaxID=117547 RepID=A0AAN9YS33_9PEZI